MIEGQSQVTPEMQERFVQMIADRDVERQTTAARMFENLTERERMLVREAAVMGFVQGTMDRPETREQFPRDAEIVMRVRNGARANNDLYPTLSALEAK